MKLLPSACVTRESDSEGKKGRHEIASAKLVKVLVLALFVDGAPVPVSYGRGMAELRRSRRIVCARSRSTSCSLSSVCSSQ